MSAAASPIAKRGHQGPLPAAKQRVKLVRGTRAIGQVIGLPERAAYYLLAKGKIPGRKLGGIWVASEDALIDYVDSLGAPISPEQPERDTAAQTASGRKRRWNKRRLPAPEAA